MGPFQWLYDRHFVRLLCRQISLNRRLRADVPALEASRRLKTLLEFDDAYTGPVCGFGSAANYYETNSAARHVAQIRIPTLIVAAQDDPLVPIGCFDSLAAPPHVMLRITERGGHLGYVGKRGVDPDRRWMDWRIVDWIKTDLPRMTPP